MSGSGDGPPSLSLPHACPGRRANCWPGRTRKRTDTALVLPASNSARVGDRRAVRHSLKACSGLRRLSGRSRVHFPGEKAEASFKMSMALCSSRTSAGTQLTTPGTSWARIQRQHSLHRGLVDFSHTSAAAGFSGPAREHQFSSLPSERSSGASVDRCPTRYTRNRGHVTLSGRLGFIASYSERVGLVPVVGHDQEVTGRMPTSAQRSIRPASCRGPRSAPARRRRRCAAPSMARATGFARRSLVSVVTVRDRSGRS